MEDAKVIATCLAVYYTLAMPVGVGVLRFAYKICNQETAKGDRGLIGIQNAAYVCVVSNVVFHAGVLGIWAYNNRWHGDWGDGATLVFYGVTLLFYFGSCLVKSVLLTRVANSLTGSMMPTIILDQIIMLTMGFAIALAFFAGSPFAEHLGH